VTQFCIVDCRRIPVAALPFATARASHPGDSSSASEPIGPDGAGIPGSIPGGLPMTP